MADMNEDEWHFWSDEAKLSCVGYSSRLDYDALNVLKGIAEKKYNTDIAQELGLPEQYVELLQSIFCSVDWCEYGTSPRGCWIDPSKDADELIAKFERYYRDRWSSSEAPSHD
jgi:glucan biosynthesis protein